MRPKALSCLVLCLLATLGFAQESVTVPLGSAGDREVFITAGLPSQPPGDSIKTKRDSVTVPIGSHRPNDAIFIWDHQTGNLASQTILAAQKGWTPTLSDFRDVAVVRVRVENDGKPVAAASVELNDTRRTAKQILSPSNQGEVTFFAVKPGPLKISVQYKDGEKDAHSDPIVFPVALDRSEPEPRVRIALSGKVDTVNGSEKSFKPAESAAPQGKDPEKNSAETKTTSSPSKSEKTSEEPSGGRNVLGTILVYVIGLAIGGGLIWFAIQYMKQNSDLVTSKLEELGAQVPKAGSGSGPDPDPVPFKPAAPAPVQKIVLDDSAPAPLGADAFTLRPPGANAVVPTAGGPARLVMDSGDSLEIPEGENGVGREIGLWLSLAAESTVSRRHATLARNGDRVTVRDDGSTNGTFVNGQQISAERVLAHGDTVQFGAVRFRFES